MISPSLVKSNLDLTTSQELLSVKLCEAELADMELYYFLEVTLSSDDKITNLYQYHQLL